MLQKRNGAAGQKLSRLWIGLLLAAALTILLAVWQRDNLNALVHFLGNSQEELEEKLEQNEQEAQELLQQTEQNMAPPAEPEPTEVPAAKPEVSMPDDETASSQPEHQPARPQPPQPEPVPEEELSAQREARLQELVAEVYGMQEHYVGLLDNMWLSAKAELKAVPEEDRTPSCKVKIMSSYLSQANALEAECDGKMDRILAEMRKLLKESGRDQKLAEEVAYTYAHEKSLKKAWYMAELDKKGLM